MKKILFILITALVLISCGKDENESSSTLSVEPVALSFTAQATESYDVTVTTDEPSWNAVSSQSWCTITKGDGKFTVRATANTSTSSPAPAVITVTAGAAKPVTINVTQSGVGAELSVNIDTPVSFTNAGGESKTITVSTNQSSWSVVSSQAWCTVNKSDNNFTITASANTETDARNAVVTVSAGNAANVTIEVTQTGVVSVDDNLKKAGFCLAYTIKITEDVKKGQRPTSISDRENWIILSPNYLPNGGLSYMDFYTYSPSSPLTTRSITEFSYNAPTSICASTSNDDTSQAASKIGAGTYDFANDPAKIMAYFGNFTGSSVFTSLGNLKLVANNDGITQEVYNKISFANNCYKIVVYGKNKNGKLIGKYVGYSTTGSSFTYWCIDADDASFGNSTVVAIP